MHAYLISERLALEAVYDLNDPHVRVYIIVYLRQTCGWRFAVAQSFAAQKYCLH